MNQLNQKDGGQKVHHGFPIDMYEPDSEQLDRQITQWIGAGVAIVLAASIVGLVTGIAYGWWLR